MLGHQDDPLYGHGWYGEQDRSDVKGMVGDYPPYSVSNWDISN